MLRKVNAIQMEVSNSIGSWKLCLGSGILIVCPVLRKMLKLSRKPRVPVKDLLVLFSRQDRSQLFKCFKTSFTTGKTFEVEIALGNGLHAKKFRVSGAVYQRRWGKVDKIIGVIEDMSQQHLVDKLRLNLIDHQIRVPICIIKLTAQQLLGKNDGLNRQSLKTMLFSIDKNIEHLGDLLAEYYAAPGERFKPVSHISVFDLGALLDAVLKEIRPVFSNYKFSRDFLTLKVRADKIKVIGDMFGHLTTAINASPNLSGVAIKFETGRGHVRVLVLGSRNVRSLDTMEAGDLTGRAIELEAWTDGEQKRNIQAGEFDHPIPKVSHEAAGAVWYSHFSLPLSDPNGFLD